MTTTSPLAVYLKELASVTQRGDAREESYYSALADMLRVVAKSTGRPHVQVTTLPKATDAGNPDFRLWNGRNRIVGYVEAKAPGAGSLDRIEESEQLARYRSTFPNLILTDFLEFRLYRDGAPVGSALAGRPTALRKPGRSPTAEDSENLRILLDRFLSFSLPKAFTAEALAVELAKRTRFLRDVVADALADEAGDPGVLSGFFEAFQTYLIGTLTREGFADLFAQTITYGLFAARTRTHGDFSRREAFDSIPQSIGVLRDLFRFISLEDLPSQLAWCVDDIAEVLAVADAPGILEQYYRDGKGSDPVVHFYETFLDCYNPEERRRRGVYYTPDPVVGYIVRSLNGMLKAELGALDGLASEGVTLLDPAAGTMTFIARSAECAVREFEAKYGSGGREDFIRTHILTDFYAFELMMAPYAIGHLKMGFLLQELGHRLRDDERMQFYLTNALDTRELERTKLPGLSALAEESRLAAAIKKEKPILVVLGNPPYSGHSSNPSEILQTVSPGETYVVAWRPKAGGGAEPVTRKAKRELRRLQPTFIGQLVRDYFFVDQRPLGEKNPKWLQDDYVKFIRLAQWKVATAGRGVVGMITNHSYLDSPTFRGMRQSLMQAFDEIYVLDLHGSTLKKEMSPDGRADVNVFDIQPGVAISFFIKRGVGESSGAVVRHASLFGAREDKYDWLAAHQLATTEWSVLEPTSPEYLFVPSDRSLDETYRLYPALPEIFPLRSVGVVTARDGLAVHWTPDDVWETVTAFSQKDAEEAREAFGLREDAQDWQIGLAQKDILDSGPSRKHVVPLLYRPMDARHTYYTGRSRGFMCRPRADVMREMLAGGNLALVTPKRVEHAGSWQHAFVADVIVDHVALSLKTIDYVTPLYLYPVHHDGGLFGEEQQGERRANVSPGVVTALTRSHGRRPTPEQIFNYVYAVLYAPAYRKKYVAFLRRDFPRVPLAADWSVFTELAALGGQLVGLHLLRAAELDPPSCQFQGDGHGKVDERRAGIRYDSERRRVWVNATQYFGPVTEATWSYRIGGYQVCLKWLKDRKGRRLGLDEIRRYCRIVTALDATARIQDEIDELYRGVELNIVPASACGAAHERSRKPTKRERKGHQHSN